ncbi:hypothetical protein ASL14_08275 [Paenibacillus sp. IHB B 3084]|uniref:histidine phosphatase family protein n=1 Tax=Paenibacillus sp. IHB B 3084 TaxID=867076 RepID=UPI0007228055|nr:histidine phosphatase family protein [Paenibacillus sp. IHB B 3084]ALP36163.1 hypothetical protein ASL14_08275 [Paenibacillus sp. IHB B 3084]
MKPKQIYVVRHGLAKGNLPDDPLTEEGCLEAKQVAAFLRQRLAGRELQIISSPYMRAIQTAEEIANVLNKDFRQESGLKERNLGDIGALHKEELSNELKKQFDDITLFFPNGESNYDVIERIKPVLHNINSNLINQPIILVTHRLTMTLLLQQYNKNIGYKEFNEITHPDVYLVDIIYDGVQVKHIWNN